MSICSINEVIEGKGVVIQELKVNNKKLQYCFEAATAIEQSSGLTEFLSKHTNITTTPSHCINTRTLDQHTDITSTH